MRIAWILGLAAVGLVATAPSCSSSGGGGGAVSCADGGTCPPGQICTAQLICVVPGTGGSGAGGGFGGSGAIGGSAGGGFGGSGATGGSAGGGFGGSGAMGGSAGGGFGGSGAMGGSAGGGFGGSGATGGSGGGSGFDCNAYCAKFLSVSCPSNPTLSECVSACQAETSAAAGQCTPEINAWMGCIQNTATFSCQDGQSVATGCQTPYQNYLACGICLFPTSTPCGTCNQQSCCSQTQAFYGDPNASVFLDCINPCTTQSCIDGCVSQYPNAGSKFMAWAQCQGTYCSAECGN